MNKEEPKNSKHQLLNRFSILFFHFCLFVFIVALAFPHNPAGNWYQQFMPNLNGRQITDITFTDSLNGYAIVNRITLQDTSFILRTTNSGDSWFFVYADSGVTYNRIQFINQTTGFVGGRINKSNIFKIVKTTNAGANWFYINAPFDVTAIDMHVLNSDTIWLVDSGSLTGGVFFTSNGGANWQNQLNLGSSNPDRIYMFNGRIGFISETNNYTRITTNSGMNWSVVFSGSGQGFYDMYFADSLTGWGTFSNTRNTVNGGFNWAVQTMPSGGNITSSSIEKLAGLNKDTIYGVGAFLLTSLGFRGMINRTTNGGENWLFQVPDSVAIQIGQYRYIDFVNKLNGWAYRTSPTGVHTTTGGDPIWFTPVTQTSSEVPSGYKLFNNYPNPFNAATKFKFQIPKKGYIQIKLYDITGRELYIITEGEYAAGVYEASFEANNFASGVYFYSLIIEGGLAETKKMILIK